PHSPDMGVMHEREHLSYSDLVPTLDVETATLHFSDVAEDGRALVILEDLCLRDVTFMSLQAPIGFDLARRFLTQMAGMHARWWEADGLKARFAVASGSPSDGVALLGRATSPPCATLLAEKLPDAIPAVQSKVIWL
ncbi:MAG: hypothetical protein ABIQ66_11665, partial [Novosphingobium sp.]